MRHYVLLLVTLLNWCIALEANASTGHWEFVPIPINDTLTPLSLTFADSLHGYFYAIRPHCWRIHHGSNKFDGTPYLFRTTDGGHTWSNLHADHIFASKIGIDTASGLSSSVQFRYGSIHVPTALFAPSSTVVSLVDHFSAYADSLSYFNSFDAGQTWEYSVSQPTSGYESREPTDKGSSCFLGALGNKIRLVGHSDTAVRFQFWVSYDAGKTFPDRRNVDSTLLDLLAPHWVRGGSAPINPNFFFTALNQQTWLITVADSDNHHNGGFDTSRPYRMISMLTTNGGATWHVNRSAFTEFGSSDTYAVQPIWLANSPYVYMFPGGSAGEGFSGEGYVPFYSSEINGFAGYDAISNVASAEANGAGPPHMQDGWRRYPANYLYSADSGKTWVLDNSFAPRRRAYEVVKPGEVWCTISKADTLRNDAMMASQIAHTTNFGASWEVDSTSLFMGEAGYFDGRIVTFSDPRHGWIYARNSTYTYTGIFRYVADDAPSSIYVPDFLETLRKYLNIYPNPAATQTTFRANIIYAITSVEIYDMIGRRCLCPIQLHPDSHAADVDIRGLVNGCYLGRVMYHGGALSLPFVVSH